MFERVIGPVTGLEFVNADIMAKHAWPGAELEHAYEASARAATRRSELLDARSSFATETVFSHSSRVDLVRDAHLRGYLVHLHVVVIPVDLAVARVAERVGDGGHDVPEEKIRQRHGRLWLLVLEAMQFATRSTFYDNSRADRPFRVIAEFEGATPIGAADWPRWAPEALIELTSSREAGRAGSPPK